MLIGKVESFTVGRESMRSRIGEGTDRYLQATQLVGLIGLCVFAFSSLVSTSGASIGLGLLVVATVMRPPHLQGLQRDPLVVLAGVSIVYLCVRTIWAIREFPESAHLQVKQAWDWFRLWFFVVVAWWLKGDLRRSGQVLLLALLGLFVGMTFYLFSHGQSLPSGQRTGFHLKIIAFGLYSSTAILGLSLLAPRIWGTKHSPPSFALRAALWFIALAVLAQGLIMTQSRGAWLTATMVIPAVSVVRYWRAGGHKGRSWRLRLGVVGVLILGCATLVLVNFSAVTTRLVQEREMFGAAWRGDLDAVPTVGFGVRVHAFRFGVLRWLERPLFGWGPGSTEYLIGRSGLPQLRHSEWVEGGWREGRAWLDHLHNTYLEILVRFGLVGAFLMLSVLGLLVRSLLVAHREGRVPLDYAWFLAGALGLMGIWSLSDFRLLHPDWRSYWILMGGIMGTFRMPPRLRGGSPMGDTSAPRQRDLEDFCGQL